MGTAPDSLDPGFGYTTQALEGDNMVYTPLLTYAYREGTPGTELIPGLATALPTISADKLTYTVTLRSGLTYSDGTKVKASDVKYGIERSIKISWGGKSFFTGYIAGAADYDAGKATDISGITADDTTGKITFKLTKPYGAFDNLLAFMAAAPVPSTTPMKVHVEQPAGRHRPVQVRQDRAERVLHADEERLVRRLQDPRHPDRFRRRGRRHDQQQHADRGPAGPQQQC